MDLQQFLNNKVAEYNNRHFIAADPISVPHRFSKLQDIEISAFFAAIFAWGNRTTIINKTNELMALMDHAPHQFCLHHSKEDLERLMHFKHRTFNTTDLLYFIEFFKYHYSQHESLETAFTKGLKLQDLNITNALNGFYEYFFSLDDVPRRTMKHIACPAKKAACKRICMFLRWMVRKDNKGVDFGLWHNISPAQLIIPLDLHVARVSANLKLIDRPAADWIAAVQLTERLKGFDAKDPVKYDFALFALGVTEKF